MREETIGGSEAYVLSDGFFGGRPGEGGSTILMYASPVLGCSGDLRLGFSRFEEGVSDDLLGSLYPDDRLGLSSSLYC